VTDQSGEDHRCQRLLRWYPASWRARYGEEFAVLLAAELAENPRSWRRGFNVRWHGAKARLAGIGIVSGPLRDPEAARTVHAFAVACFLVAATFLWAQVVAGSSSAPTAHPPVAAMRVVIAVTFGLLAMAALARLHTLVRRIAVAVRTEGLRQLAAPLLMIGCGGAAFAGDLVAVWSHLRYPITAPTVAHVTTLSISTYWLHPRLLLRFDHVELGWMILSPIAFLVVGLGVSRLSRRLHQLVPAPRVRHPWPARSLLLVPALAVSVWWMVSSQHYRMPMLRAETVDVALIAAMTFSLGIAAATERNHVA
jgi:hypothetical protein